MLENCSLPAVSAALAYAFADKYTAAELAILSSFFNSVGDNLGIIAAQKAACSDSGDTVHTR